MAYTPMNRLLVVKLYGSSTPYLANVSPRNLVLNSTDNVYIVVELPGNSSGTYYGSLTFTTAIVGSSTTVNLGSSSNPNTLGTVYKLGTVGTFNNQTIATYTLSITYNGSTYSEDPQIQINPNP